MKKFAMIMIVPSLFILSSCRGGSLSSGETASVAPVSATRWTGKTELFLEYPPLVAGRVSRFSVHLTELERFKPLTSGRVIVELKTQEGKTETFQTDEPSRPGIFGLDVKPAAAGLRVLLIRYDSTGLSDIHDVGQVQVYSGPDNVQATAGESETSTIPFLKEQQWTLDYTAQAAAERLIRPSLRVPGEIRARTGGDIDILAPIAGRLTAGDPPPEIGTSVKAGRILARLIPQPGSFDVLAGPESALREAEAEAGLARRDRERTERLIQAGAAPAKRLDEAKAAEAKAEARSRAAEARLGQFELTRDAGGEATDAIGRFIIRAPIDGVLAASNVTPGSAVAERQRLFRVVNLDPVHIVAAVPEGEAWRLEGLSGGEVEVPGRAESLPLGRAVSVGRVVDPGSRTLSVIFEIRNTESRLAIGQSVLVRLFSGSASKVLSVPESAVIDDAGRPVVFVQISGEAFLRRPVRLGGREGGFVQILEGLKTGDRVVTSGAYQIRLAALSPQVPAHGHVH